VRSALAMFGELYRERSPAAVEGYEDWLARLFPSYATAPLAEHHHQFWQWVWALERGLRPRPFVGLWARGGAKSTSAELACVAVGDRASRRYVLYVSGTAAQADDHVANVGGLLESEALGRHNPKLSERSVGKYGASRGWRRNRLRTSAGLTVDALGLDVAARGVKLDEQRPDLIIFDDVDDASDSIDTIRKNVRSITQKILPAGSSDVATLFIQNVIHHESIAARLCGLASEPAEFLADRQVSGPVPALVGFKAERIPGTLRWRITGGEPTWVGQDLAVCQAQVDDWGIRAFRAEAQHEQAPPEGQAFSEWDRSIHVVAPYPIPDSWVRWRALDYGFAAPHACLWLARAPSGAIVVYREAYGAGLTAKEQALAIRALSAGEKYFVSVADPAIWAENREGERYKSIAAQYAEMGIHWTKASNSRLIGWERLHELLDWGEGVPPVLTVMSGCTNLIRTLPLLPKDPHKPEDVDTTAEDHAADALRYGVMAASWLDLRRTRKPREYGVGRR